MSVKELVSESGRSLPKRDAIAMVVVGDSGVGKTSLISSLVSESFTQQIPSVLQPVIVPSELTTEKIPFAIIDTAAPAVGGSAVSVSNHGLTDDTVAHLRSADVIVLGVAADQPSSFDRVSGFWLPLFATLSVSAPIVVAINKSDLALTTATATAGAGTGTGTGSGGVSASNAGGVAICKQLYDSLRVCSCVSSRSRRVCFALIDTSPRA